MSLKEEYQLDYLKENDFIRKKCSDCGSYFWTLDEEREVCGDPPCEEYSFINNSPFDEEYSLSEMREKFLKFFEERKHSRYHRHPVIARWRDDIFLTIASVADFQPHVTTGEVEPPANPLTVSQPCIRLDDIDSVGKSGRHLIIFEMMAHHAFNSEDNRVYWKDKTVELCQELLTELGVPEEEVIYKENPWAGGGNAGPAFEVIVRGLELSTLVFMNMEESPDGEYEIKDKKYRKMDKQIVDTGYGLERFVWASKGSATIYDAIFGEVVEKLIKMAGLEEKIESSDYKSLLTKHSKLAGYMDVDTAENLHQLRKKVAEEIGLSVDELKKKMEPIEELYSLADHTRAITFMLGDGIVPSNVKAGYLVRLVIRRSLRIMNSLGIDQSLFEVVKLHINDLEEDYPEFEEKKETISEILDQEQTKYQKTLEKGKKLVKKTADYYKEKNEQIPEEEIIDLYDTHGIPPEIIKEISRTQGVQAEIPNDFYSKVAKKHSSGEKKEQKKETIKEIRDLPKTDILYYEQPEDYSFESVVLEIFDNKVVLDQTLFYPEGGGQPADKGEIVTDEGIFEIEDVQNHQGIVIHELNETGELKKGDVVEGRIDEERRRNHKRHHTATHLILGATKKVLGNHVWQTGSELGEEKARLDITHFKNISEEELREIELKANEVVMENRNVKRQWINRNEAQEKYGFELYQGGAPRGKEIRIIEVEEWNVQACGGTHVEETGNIGPIKVLGTESIQDGVIRINFSAGKAAIQKIHETEQILKEAAETFSVPTKELPKTSKRFFKEWKERGKTIEELKKEIATYKRKELLDKSQELGEYQVITKYIKKGDMEELRNMVEEIDKKDIISFLINQEGEFVIYSGEKARENKLGADKLVRKLTQEFNGGGGGSAEMAQGKLNKEKIKEAKKRFLELPVELE